MRHSILVTLAISLLACGQADFTDPPVPPPVKTTGTVVLATIPTHEENALCSMQSSLGVVTGPVPAGTLIEEVIPGLYEPTCVADGFESTHGTAFFVKAGDSLVIAVPLIATNPPPETEAVIWIASNIPAHVDSMVRYASDGSQVSSRATQGNTPLRTTVVADGSLYAYFVSAEGFTSSVVYASPKPGDQITLEANLSLVPAVPGTTGTLLVASSPAQMNAEVSFIKSDGSDSTVAHIVTNAVLTLEAGFYHVSCSDSHSQFSPVSTYTAVNPDENSIAVCVMPKVAENPAAPSVSISASTLSINSGDPVVISVSGTNITNGFISPLNIFALGGSFTDRPFTTTQYCFVGFGRGGIAKECVTVTVRPPGPNLKPDTTRLYFPDPTVTVKDPRVFLWGLVQTFSGPYRDDIPVRIRVHVKYTSTKDESFAIRMQLPGPPGSNTNWAGYVLKSGTTNPVVADVADASGWRWIEVGGFLWPNGSSFQIWAFHGSLFDIRNGIEGHLYDPKCPYGPVSFDGIEFIRWVPTP